MFDFALRSLTFHPVSCPCWGYQTGTSGLGSCCPTSSSLGFWTSSSLCSWSAWTAKANIWHEKSKDEEETTLVSYTFQDIFTLHLKPRVFEHMQTNPDPLQINCSCFILTVNTTQVQSTLGGSTQTSRWLLWVIMVSLYHKCNNHQNLVLMVQQQNDPFLSLPQSFPAQTNL